MSAPREKAVGRDAPHGPWNPGLRSPVPRSVLPRSTLYRPENMILSIAGDVTHEEAYKIALETFGKLPKGKLDKDTIAAVLGALSPEHAIVADESVTTTTGMADR